ncbi:hypothetical protein G6F57_000231 [Rhizopus arrhizus]|uniref:Trehalose 6-phosphate phosphatase n=1 Tax=Rhizopus oryzae TaxID=64495 RepID=A0A9P7BXU0_RHIOR|nr:hypothetical protein G6F23_004590 [Rhizopus arrhizus]KAG1429184.1 hypothetical protein G6F58_000163 [Rhizopus delemar]KAG0769026.1 hypothetical protein G6F24_001437 [Rhizopus arrhizus]KAG0795803.1 hypothetical protein G6F21_001827 [Rhizopus arrhizus]KAG0802676.1 hypothetical protein G6F22_000031 [Rhizopus arrhizus]
MIAKYTQPLNSNFLVTAYKDAHKRLFLFDYDGTLTPIVNNPADAQPTSTLLHCLHLLCKDPANIVWVISGRDQLFLDLHLGSKIPRLGLSAEHGSFMKKTHDWTDMLENADMSWKEKALGLFQKYTDQNPGTVIEQKKSSITWHYRNAVDIENATKQSELCFDELKSLSGVDILVGKMNVEVRSIMVNKGEVVKRIKENEGYDFILCAGDDRTDEDMFRVLEDEAGAYCVSVGPVTKETKAKYSVESSEDILNVLGQLVSLTTNSAL